MDWIAVDWGTSRLRVWAMADQNDVPLKEARSDRGMGQLTRDDFEPALLDLVGDWLSDQRQTPVIACGMVGSRQGWSEAPYAAVPSEPLAAAMARATTKDQRLRVWIIPGLKQTSPADVMRGEETQIAGFQAMTPDFDGVICLPGTHSKWAHVSAGEVVSFRTFMTGELFACLADATVLRHSVATSGWDETGFSEGLDITLSRPERLASELFSLRASDLLEGTGGAVARARLSGLLIGAELAAAKPYWLGQSVAVIGSEASSAPYLTALRAQGVAPIRVDGSEMSLRGLRAAFETVKDTVP
ncbi:MAG: 2-dehydro-3-deoxygalactonokinase [Pseudomonadota bacterium]